MRGLRWFWTVRGGYFTVHGESLAPLSANPACAPSSRGDYARTEQIKPIPTPSDRFRDPQKNLDFCLGSDRILSRIRHDSDSDSTGSDSDSTGFDSDPTQGRVGAGPGEPCLSILSTSNRKNEKNPRFFSFFRFEVLKIGKERGFPGEPGRIRREPRMCSDEQGRTSECIHGSSKNLGMYSRIERPPNPAPTTRMPSAA